MKQSPAVDLQDLRFEYPPQAKGNTTFGLRLDELTVQRGERVALV